MKTPTDKELDAFYGTPATEQEWKDAQADASRHYDADDIQVAACENADALIQAMKDRRFADVGHILNRARLITIDRRAEFALFGRITTQCQGVSA